MTKAKKRIQESVPTTKAGETTQEKEQIIGGRFAIQFDLNYRGIDRDKSEGESQTIPDMNLTVRQLMANHTRGIDNKIHEKQAGYFDIQVPSIQDWTDVEKYKQQLERELVKTKEFIKKEQQDAKANKEKAAKAEAEKTGHQQSSKTDDKGSHNKGSAESKTD